MQEFTNETINLDELPKFEQVPLQSLQPKYFTVIAINRTFFNLVLLIAFFILHNAKYDMFSSRIWLIAGMVLPVILGLNYALARLSFNKKGFAFREHDAIFKEGLLSETTTIVPFNRVQHVALHQGFIARKLGLASIELFTAGGSSSDLEIPGLLLEQAQQIKNMVAQKINPPKIYPENPFPENITADENEIDY